MAMVNMNNLLNGKDSRWLQLEVCREFQRNKCSRPDTECKFAHPPANVEVQNGRVTACYDSIKVRIFNFVFDCVIWKLYSYFHFFICIVLLCIFFLRNCEMAHVLLGVAQCTNEKKKSIVFFTSIFLRIYLRAMTEKTSHLALKRKNVSLFVFFK